MSLFPRLSMLALQEVIGGACRALNLAPGEAAVNGVANWLSQRFLDESQRLNAALRQASEQAWQTLESALVDDSHLARFQSLLATAEVRAFRNNVRRLIAAAAQRDERFSGDFRRYCLEELHHAQRNGLFHEPLPEPEQMARQTAAFARFTDPQQLLTARLEASRQLSAELKQAGHVHLALLLALRPSGKEPLLVEMVRYFFRRAVEEDAKLFHGLAFAQLEGLTAGQARALGMLEDVLKKVEDLRSNAASRPAGTATRPVPCPWILSEEGLALNAEPRLPCILLLDSSKSMAGERIEELNYGLQVYHTELNADDLARQRVEVAIVTFGTGVELVCPFVTADAFQPPVLSATGKTTPLGQAIHWSLDVLEQRRRQYRRHGLPTCFRPWIFLITDGKPKDEWQAAAQRIQQGEGERHFWFHAVGVEGADLDILRALTGRPAHRLHGLRFRDLFRWLSQSQRSVSRSSPGLEDRIPFADPTAPGGWASR